MPKFKELDLDGRRVSPENFQGSRLRRKKKSHPIFKATLALIFLVILGIVIWFSFFSKSSVFDFMASTSNLESTNGRVNVLLIGIGGGNHDGPNLTDSIIVASYDLQTHHVTLFSVPRDLWLPSISEKINAAYEVGLAQGDGLTYTENAIGKVMGLQIPYAAVIDFDGFAKAVDLVGGIDVDVQNTFDDYQYPITGKENDMCGYQQKTEDLTPDQAKALNVPPGNTSVIIDPQGNISTDSATLNFSCRFMHIHFNKGWTHMDGQTALEYVRSRHAEGIEGTDFARSARQQLVIQAFRSKILSVKTLANPQKVIGLFQTLGSSVNTNIPSSDYLAMYDLVKNEGSTTNIVLGDLGNGQSLLINPPFDQYGGAYVLIPENNDPNVVPNFVQQTFQQEDVIKVSSSPSSK